MVVGNRRHKFGKIFISYRRSDSTAFSHRLYETLSRIYGSDILTFDVDSITSVVEFRTYIVEGIAAARVFIGVIVAGRRGLGGRLFTIAERW